MVLGGLVGFVNQLAQLLGYGVLLIIGLMATGHVLSMWWWKTSSWEAKQTGVKIQKETGMDSGAAAKIADMLTGEFDDLGDDRDIHYEPSPSFSVDWSLNRNATEDDVRRLKSALESAGFYLHPYPRSPDEYPRDEWYWSDKNAGIWTEDPEFYIEREDEREPVNPDLSTWEIET